MLVLFEDVYLGYNGKSILKNINMRINEPGIVLIQGPNGSGKTTLLKAIAGLIRPLKGEIVVLGRKPYSPFFDRRDIGYVAQDPVHQLTEPTVLEELLLQSDSKDKAVYWAKRLGIYEILHESPLNISVGEMKRVLIAAVLARNSKIILIDEPSLGQDNRSLNTIVRALKEYADNGRLVIVASHDERITHCLSLISKLYYIDGGRIVERKHKASTSIT